MARQSKADPVPVLLTRPEAQSRAFAATLRDRFGDGVAPVIAPLMGLEPLSPTTPGGTWAGVIFTSAQGVEAATRLPWLTPGPAWCVGGKTAAAAQAAGFDAVSADGDADDLVALIRAARPGGQVLHLRGEDSRGEVAARLRAAGIAAEALVVYRQRALPLSDAARNLLSSGGVVVVPLFSPRTAGLFSAACPPGARLRIAAMSAAVAEAISVPYQALEVAARPDAEAMVEAVARLIAAGSAP